MKVTFFGNVLYEGDNCQEELTKIKNSLLESLSRIDKNIKETYFKRECDTNEVYYENIKVLNPQLYQDLEYIKESIGEGFTHYEFERPDSRGIIFYVDCNGKHTWESIGSLYLMLAFDLKSELKIQKESQGGH